MTDKLQVHTVTHIYKVESSCKNIFCRNNTQICCRLHVGAAKLGNHLFLQQSLLNNVFWFSQALTEDWKNITNELAARAVLSFLF